MTSVALGLIYRYGTRTLPQNDEVWVLYDAGPSIHLSWLWATWAEHRIPLAKLIWKSVLQLTGHDFRAGNFLTVLALATFAAAMIWTARKFRGRTILADAFFPLAILNFGQAQVFLWWWQINHVLAPLLAGALLTILLLHGNHLKSSQFLWIGFGLIVLVLCGPGGLPYVAGFAAWLTIRMWSTRQQRDSIWLFLPVLAALALVAFYFVNYAPYFPVNNPPSIPSWPPPAGLRASSIAALEILGVSLGIATKPYAVLCGSAVFALGALTTLILIHNLLKEQREQRMRSIGMLMFLGASATLVFIIGRSRAGMGLDYIYQGHYLILVVPALCCIYFIWEMRADAVARVIQFSLVLILAALIPLNLRAAVEIGQDLQQKTTAFEQDVKKGIPASVLAERHFASDVVPRADKLAIIVKDHKAKSIGLFKQVRDDPASRVETVDPGMAALDRISLDDGIATSSTASDHPLGSLTWTLNRPRHIYAIRLHYAYIRAAAAWPTLHVYWRNSTAQEFNPASAFFSTVAAPDQPTWALVDGKIQTSAKLHIERTLTIWVDMKIDQFRIYLDSAPCAVRFARVELLVPTA